MRKTIILSLVLALSALFSISSVKAQDDASKRDTSVLKVNTASQLKSVAKYQVEEEEEVACCDDMGSKKCKKKCGKKSKSCKKGCKKACCAKKADSKSCKKGCEKACCAKKEK